MYDALGEGIFTKERQLFSKFSQLVPHLVVYLPLQKGQQCFGYASPTLIIAMDVFNFTNLFFYECLTFELVRGIWCPSEIARKACTSFLSSFERRFL